MERVNPALLELNQLNKREKNPWRFVGCCVRVNKACLNSALDLSKRSVRRAFCSLACANCSRNVSITTFFASFSGVVWRCLWGVCCCSGPDKETGLGNTLKSSAGSICQCPCSFFSALNLPDFTAFSSVALANFASLAYYSAPSRKRPLREHNQSDAKIEKLTSGNIGK